MTNDQDIDFDALFDRIKAFKVSGHELYLRGFEDGKKAAIQVIRNYIRNQDEEEEMETGVVECCKTCKHCSRDNTFKSDYFCVNPKSEHVADWVNPTEDVCEHWAKKIVERRRKK